MNGVILADGFIRREQGREGVLPCLCPHCAKAEGEDELAVAGCQVDLGRQCDVSVLRAVVFPRHLEMLRQVLPAVRDAGKSDGTLSHRRRRRQSKRATVALRKQHRSSLVISHPARVAMSKVREVRRQ